MAAASVDYVRTRSLKKISTEWPLHGHVHKHIAKIKETARRPLPTIYKRILKRRALLYGLKVGVLYKYHVKRKRVKPEGLNLQEGPC